MKSRIPAPGRRWLTGGGKALPPLPVLAPALVVGVALLLPPGYLVVRALDGGGESLWDLLFRQRVAAILGRTLLLVVTVTLASAVVALPLAWLTVRTDLPFRRVWAVLTALPLVIPSYVAGFVVVVVLGPRGMLQQALEGPFGIERLPDIYGLAGAMFTLTFLSYPYLLLTVRAALLRLDPALEESARGLGQGPWQTFFRVVAPLMRPAIASGSLLVGLYTLSDFGAVSLLRYETFTWAIFTQYESALDRTLGAGLSLVLIALALGWVGLELLTRGRGRYYSSSSQATRPAETMRLGRWRWPALGLCGAVTAVSLGLPISVLCYWVARGVSAGRTIGAGLGHRLELGLHFGPGRLGRRGGRPSRSRLGRATPWAAERGLGAARLRGVRAARHHGSSGVGVLRGQLRPAFVPDHRYVALGLRGAVPLPGLGGGKDLPAPDDAAIRGSGAQLGPRALGRVYVGHAARGPARHRGGGVAGVPAGDEGTAGHPHPQPRRVHHLGDLHLVGGFGSLLRPRRHARPVAGAVFRRPPRFPHAPGTPVGYNLASLESTGDRRAS